jgi:hypothetical protein
VAALRGDLDWITLKALARERERRYRSVDDLIADLERHRQGLPVLAGPPSARYRLRKFVRRHRVAVRAGAAAVALVAVGLGLAWAQGRRAHPQVASARTEADAAFETAAAAADSLLARANDDRVRRARESDGLRQALVRDALAFYDRFLGSRPSDPALREGRCRALLTLRTRRPTRRGSRRTRCSLPRPTAWRAAVCSPTPGARRAARSTRPARHRPPTPSSRVRSPPSRLASRQHPRAGACRCRRRCASWPRRWTPRSG